MLLESLPAEKFIILRPAGLIGQAAGAAAAESIREKKDFRATDAKAVRSLLKEQDVLLPE